MASHLRWCQPCPTLGQRWLDVWVVSSFISKRSLHLVLAIGENNSPPMGKNTHLCILTTGNRPSDQRFSHTDGNAICCQYNYEIYSSRHLTVCLILIATTVQDYWHKYHCIYNFISETLCSNNVSCVEMKVSPAS